MVVLDVGGESLDFGHPPFQVAVDGHGPGQLVAIAVVPVAVHDQLRLGRLHGFKEPGTNLAGQYLVDWGQSEALHRRTFGAVVGDQHIQRSRTQLLDVGIGQDLTRPPAHMLHPLATVDRERPAERAETHARPLPAMSTGDIAASIGDCDDAVLVWLEFGQCVVVFVVAIDPVDAVDALMFGMPADLLEISKPVGGVRPVAEITELQDRVAAVTVRELAQCADPARVAVHIAGEQQSRR